MATASTTPIRSQQSYPPKLSFWEKADLVPAVIYCLGFAVRDTISGIFRGEKDLQAFVGRGFLRNFSHRLSRNQCQALWPPTDTTYQRFMRQKGAKPETVSLPHGALGHWLGNKNAKNVLVFYHGGGFQYPGMKEHFEFVSKLVDSLNALGHDLAAFFLTYTLTPYAVYPTQLQQAVEALRYILTETGRSPADVFIAGDSAGGNLVFAVLGHLSHPHPGIDRLDIPQPLAGAVGIGPWVGLNSGLPPEAQQSRFNDVTDIKGTTLSGQAYSNGKEDNWSMPFLTSPDWWKDAKVKDTLIVAGTDEVLLSSVKQFEKIFKTAVPNTTLVLGSGECHVAPVYNLMINIKAETEQEKALKSWLIARL